MNVTHNCPIENEKQLVVAGTVKKHFKNKYFTQIFVIAQNDH